MPIPVDPAPQLRRAGRWLLGTSLLAIGVATLLPASGTPDTTVLCIVCGARGGVDVVLNVLLFLPLGVALAMCRVRPRPAIVFMATFSACIEIAQFAVIAGRDATVGDLLMNTVGGALGVALVRTSDRWIRPQASAAVRLALAWAGLWLLVQALASYAFAPELPATRYYGQLGRSLSSFATFRGTVSDVQIGPARIPDRIIDDSSVHGALAEGRDIVATVVAASPPPRLAPIVRIADATREEIMLLGQDHRTLVFGIRTGAASLRVRPPLFGLKDAFDAPSSDSGGGSGDVVRLRAHYGARVALRAERAGRIVGRDIRAGPELAWTLVLPFQWYIEGRFIEGVLTSLWIAACLLPIGYWMRRATNDGRGRDGAIRAVEMLCVVLLLGLGLALIPLWFHLAPCGPVPWIAAIAGSVLGCAIANRVTRITNPC